MDGTYKNGALCVLESRWSSSGERVFRWDCKGVERGNTILRPIKTGHEHVWAVVYSPDTTMFATAGADWSDQSIRIWDTKTGELVTTLNGHTNTVWSGCLAWSPDGKTLISGSTDCLMRTWNTKTWKQLAVLDGHITWASYVTGIAISPNGRILESTTHDETARLWNLENSQPISSPLHHPDPVRCVSFSADGKLLATACYEKNAYMWDVSAILQEAGLDDLLLDQPDKSLLAADATQRPVRQPIKVSPGIPRGFFDDTPHLSARPHSLSSPSHRTLRSRLLSLFRPINPHAHDTPSRPRPFHWVRRRLPGGTDIELYDRPSAEVAVPYAKGKRRNASARERRRPIMKRPTASSSRPPNTTVTQQSTSMPQAQSSSQPHATVSTTPPVAANTTSSASPHTTIKYPTRWTRFWLFVCCASPEYTDGHS